MVSRPGALFKSYCSSSCSSSAQPPPWRSRSTLAQITAHHPLFKLFLSLILRDRSPCGGEFPGTFDSFLLLTHIIVPRLLLLLSCCCPPLLLRSLLLLSSLSFPSLLRLFSSRCAFWLLHSLLLLSSLVLRSIDAAVLLALLHALPFAARRRSPVPLHIRSPSPSFMQFISLNFFSRCSSA